MDFKKINLGLAAFSLFSLRLVIFGASVGDALALFAIAGLIGFGMYLKSIEKPAEIPLNESVLKDIHDLKNAIVAMKIGRGFGK